MGAPAATLEELLATVRRLERKVDALKRPPEHRLLSKRAAARLLGVDRGTTLERYIRDGHLRLVDGKIPDVEIERLLTEGVPAEPPRPRRHPAPKRAPEAIDAIRLDDL